MPFSIPFLVTAAIFLFAEANTTFVVGRTLTIIRAFFPFCIQCDRCLVQCKCPRFTSWRHWRYGWRCRRRWGHGWDYCRNRLFFTHQKHSRYTLAGFRMGQRQCQIVIIKKFLKRWLINRTICLFKFNRIIIFFSLLTDHRFFICISNPIKVICVLIFQFSNNLGIYFFGFLFI